MVVAAPDLPSPGDGNGCPPAIFEVDFLLNFGVAGLRLASYLATFLTSVTFLASFLGLETFDPPTTLALVADPSFLRAYSPFSSLRMLPIGRIGVFPSLNVHALKSEPFAN